MIAMGHLFRFALHVPVVIGDWSVPMGVSPVAGVLLAALVFALWREDRAVRQG
jgi:hypothetical protein